MPPAKAKKKEIAQPEQSTSSARQGVLPNWPPLRPLVPSSDLYLDAILPDQIYLIRNFFTVNLCRTYTSFLASSLSLTTTPLKPKSKDEAVRVNDRFQVQDQAFAEALWSGTALKELVLEHRGLAGADVDLDEERRHQVVWGGDPLGLNPNIRIYRYSPGQFFAQHYDDSNNLRFTRHQSSRATTVSARTTWTLLIYLTTTEGGETIFYPEGGSAPIPVAPEVGMALLHRHGDECLLHEGKEVRSGEKWVIRSDLVVER